MLAIAAIVFLTMVDDRAKKPVAMIHVKTAPRIDRLLKGIPQYGLILGAEDAPVELAEFGDFQSARCKRYAERILPSIIAGPVRSGEVKIAFRSVDLLGPLSASAGAAALAAGEESRGWNYLELIYLNQNKGKSGDTDEELLGALARAAGVKHMESWRKRRKLVAFEIEHNTKAVRRLGFSDTPVFAIRGPGTKGFETLGRPKSTGELEVAIRKAGTPEAASSASS